MKKAAAVLMFILLFAASSFAASIMTPTVVYGTPVEDSMILIKVECTAHTNGTFDPYQIIDTISSEKYWQGRYYLLHAWAVNDATTYPSSGEITITGITGQQLIGTASGDVLALSTSASGLGSLSASRGAAQRPVVDKLTVTSTTVTTNAGKFNLYILLGR